MLLLLWLLAARAILQLLPLLLYRIRAQPLHLKDLWRADTLIWLLVRIMQLLLYNRSGSSWCSCKRSCCSPIELPQLFLQAYTGGSFLLEFLERRKQHKDVSPVRIGKSDVSQQFRVTCQLLFWHQPCSSRSAHAAL
jgi:hypothetical protein